MQPIESECPTPTDAGTIHQALQTLRRAMHAHLESEARLDRLYRQGHELWSAEFSRLQQKVEQLESQLSPWIAHRQDGPRLAVVPQTEEVI